MNINKTERSRVEISLDNLRHNLRALKAFLRDDQSFMQIVKADAYGHGAYEISKLAISEGAVMLGVANMEEGKLLRLQGITIPILILSPALISEIPSILEYDLIPTISGTEFATALNDHARRKNITATIHLKADTGMHRSGADRMEFEALLSLIPELTALRIEGLYSHYAASEADRDYSLKQLRYFEELIPALPSELRYTHIANSSALINGLTGNTNLVRLGILSYGLYTAPEQHRSIDLRPVMTFKATLSQIKEIKAGESLGYNLTWQAERDTRYAIAPIGYADGYDYLLGNRGHALLRGTLCPVIGKISMDMITLDVTDIPEAKTGDELVLLGAGTNEIRAENITAIYGGSSYELLCQIGRRAKRHYYLDGQLVSSAPLSRRDFVPDDFSDNKLSDIIETAVSQRLGSEEIGSLVYGEMLASLFSDRDKDIHYRRNFVHSISFELSPNPELFSVRTSLRYEKILDNDYFIVACANREDLLNRYFQKRDVEYRWLMDDNFALTQEDFRVSAIQVNGLDLDTTVTETEGCLEIRCSHPRLKDLVGTMVEYNISTRTHYPRRSHQLSVFITEMTRGVSISFEHPDSPDKVECIPIYSGQNKYPTITRSNTAIHVETKPTEWTFPISGVVFAY